MSIITNTPPGARAGAHPAEYGGRVDLIVNGVEREDGVERGFGRQLGGIELLERRVRDSPCRGFRASSPDGVARNVVADET